jgi:hypothetical protein
VRLAQPLFAPRLQLNLLPRPQPSYQDVVVHRTDGVVGEALVLVALSDPLEVAGRDARADDAAAIGTAARAAAAAAAAAAASASAAATAASAASAASLAAAAATAAS